MKRSLLFFCLFFFVFAVRVHAATPNPPSLKIIIPEADSVVSSTVKVQFEVKNFELTTQPSKKEHAGVIAVYVDGKFFTNSASTSAQLYIPRTGTHYIEAELTRTNRESIVPRVTDTRYIHIQKKSPYLRVKNIVHTGTVYTDTPVLDVDFIQNAYEDQDSYYQVFIDGQVDGDSRELADKRRYTIQTPLTEGTHSLRLVLYDSKGAPYRPTVDSQVSFVYSADIPIIRFVDLSESDGEVPFNISVDNFSIPKQGYLIARYGQTEDVFATTSGVLKNVPPGEKIHFSLVGRDGRDLLPPTITYADAPIVAEPVKSREIFNFQNNGFFSFNEGVSGRIGFLILAVFEAIMVIFVASYLTHRHHRTRAG